MVTERARVPKEVERFEAMQEATKRSLDIEEQLLQLEREEIKLAIENKKQMVDVLGSFVAQVAARNSGNDD